MPESLSIEAIVAATIQGYTAVRPSMAAVVATFVPTASQVFIEKDTESWNPQTGRASRQISWVYQ